MDENRLKIIRDDLGGISQAKLADITGIPLYKIKYAETSTAKISREIAKRIDEKLGYNHLWVLTGEGKKLTKQDHHSSAKGEAESEVNHDDNFVTIPRFSDKISAGGGLIPVNEVEIKVAFRRDWIQKKGDPEKMSLIAVSGDSMEPTLMTGDLVLINHGHNHLDPQGGIYAIALDDVILIKRLQILYPTGKVRIISDNSKYDSFDLSQEEVRINGRVIWFGREI